MRVFLTADTVGGVWDHVATLAGELRSAGDEVLVAVVGERRDDRLAALAPGVEVTSRSYRLEWMQGAAADVPAAGEWLAHTARLWCADVVHLNQYAYAVHDFGAPVLVAGHSDVLSWWRETLGRAAPAEWREYGGWVRAGLAAADAVVTPTLYQSRLLLREYGRAADQVIHNGILPVEGAGPPADGSDGVLVVCACRAWDRAKGAEVLDRAVGRLGGAGVEAHLLGATVAPSGERYEPLHLTSHGRVERSEVDAWLSRASVYVAPSLYEPFGLAPLEAAFAGCALLLSDIGSFRELWDGCARFFPAGNDAALAAALTELHEGPASRDRMASAARRRAERRYTADRMAADYRVLYAELAVSGSPAASTAEVRA